MTAAPGSAPLEQELVKLGMSANEAVILASAFAAEPVSDWLTGFEDIAAALADDTKPRLVPSSAEPWRTIHGHMMVNGQKPEDSYQAALKLWPPDVRMVLDGLVWIKVGDLLAVKQQGGTGASKRRRVKTAEYIAALRSLGYAFRLNDATEQVEINGYPISDSLRAEIRSRMRDTGFEFVNIMEDAYLAEAHHNRYHPVKEYLDGLKYDGGQHIETLATHFIDKYGVFESWLRHWLIGAVAKVLGNEQNEMLILDGPQGIGKSLFAQWLGSGLPSYFCEAELSFSDKDTYIQLMSKWIWELGEFGQTLRRVDRETLKNFITKRMVNIRVPYGHYSVDKPALASMIGTVNNEVGLLDDPTGSRRFLITRIEKIDWSYQQLNVHQIWAQAHALYLSGTPWQITAAERQQATSINEQYEIEDPIEGYLLRLFKVEPTNNFLWTSSNEILTTLETAGLKGVTRSNSMGLGITMKRLGCERKKQRNSQGQWVWGYLGVIVI